MAINFGPLRRLVLGVSIEIMDKFWDAHNRPNTQAKQELRHTSNALLESYNQAIELGLSPELRDRLLDYDTDLQGFAHKGAGMGLIFLDFLSPGGTSRFHDFINEYPQHINLIHVGAGIAMWVLKKDIEKTLAVMPPLSRWWAMDGFGFYDGVSNWRKSLDKHLVPNRVQGYAKRAYDQGLGRSIWFLYNTDIDGIVNHIHQFPVFRHGDLWSGVGLASTYTGGVEAATLNQLRTASGDHALDVAVGSALAANARYLADNIVPHTELACSMLCDRSAVESAQLTLAILEKLPVDSQESVTVELPVYETYRRQLRQQLGVVEAIA